MQQSLLPARHAGMQTREARQFFAWSVGMLGSAGVIASLLGSVFGRPAASSAVRFPMIFYFTTLLLAGVSFSLHQATVCVRRERQSEFRRWLVRGMGLATLFLGMQGHGVWRLLPRSRVESEASTGVTALVMMFSGLHGMHVLVAGLFLAFVLTRALLDRYDHEYHWAVRVCGWFWHLLGIVWLEILAVFAIAF